MKLTLHKRLAGIILKASKKRIRFNPAKLEDIKEAITKEDMRRLIKEGSVKVKQKKGVSRVRARKIARQKRKGLRRGTGSKKGTSNARIKDKTVWMRKVRTQRAYLKELKNKGMLKEGAYRDLYRKIKGNFFRSKRHIRLYLEDRELLIKKGAEK